MLQNKNTKQKYWNILIPTDQMQTLEIILLTIQLQTVGRNMMISTHVTNAKCNQYYNVYVGSNSS